jgi:hypothetical protein
MMIPGLRRRLLPVVAVALAALPPARAAFTVEVRTTSTPPTQPPPTWPPTSNRLFSSGFGAAPDVQAPLGTSVWIVADGQNDGLPALSYADRQLPPEDVLGSDDVLLKYDLTDGTAPGSIAGRYFGSATGVDDSLKTANFYFVVWGSGFAPVTEAAVLPGMTFGAFNMGVPNVPQVGNAGLGVSVDLFADQYTVVPEPSGLSLLGLAGLVAWARRRARG